MAQGRVNGATNANRTHSWKYASLACKQFHLLRRLKWHKFRSTFILYNMQTHFIFEQEAQRVCRRVEKLVINCKNIWFYLLTHSPYTINTAIRSLPFQQSPKCLNLCDLLYLKEPPCNFMIERIAITWLLQYLLGIQPSFSQRHFLFNKTEVWQKIVNP